MKSAAIVANSATVTYGTASLKKATYFGALPTNEQLWQIASPLLDEGVTSFRVHAPYHQEWLEHMRATYPHCEFRSYSIPDIAGIMLQRQAEMRYGSFIINSDTFGALWCQGANDVVRVNAYPVKYAGGQLCEIGPSSIDECNFPEAMWRIAAIAQTLSGYNATQFALFTDRYETDVTPIWRQAAWQIHRELNVGVAIYATAGLFEELAAMP